MKRMLFDCVTDILITDSGAVILGYPHCDDEKHNCDYAGCGSCGDHVLYRNGEAQCATEEVGDAT